MGVTMDLADFKEAKAAGLAFWRNGHRYLIPKIPITIDEYRPGILAKRRAKYWEKYWARHRGYKLVKGGLPERLPDRILS